MHGDEYKFKLADFHIDHHGLPLGQVAEIGVVDELGFLGLYTLLEENADIQVAGLRKHDRLVDASLRRQAIYEFLHMSEGLDLNQRDHLRIENGETLHLTLKSCLGNSGEASEIPRAMSYLAKTVDEVIRLTSFLQGGPDSRIEMQGAAAEQSALDGMLQRLNKQQFETFCGFFHATKIENFFEFWCITETC